MSGFRTIYENLKRYRHIIKLWYYLKFPVKDKVILLGTPEHNNIGDSAIVIAEINLFKTFFPNSNVKEITFDEYEIYRNKIRKYASKSNLIICHGGGNIGNIWRGLEENRYKVLSDFPQTPTIIMPQTVYFTDEEDGKIAIEKSKTFYDKAKQLTITAREKTSYDILNTLYTTPQKLLTPDVVLSTTMRDYGISAGKRMGGLLVFRNDKERAMTDSSREFVISWLNRKGINYRITDMYSDEPVSKKNRKMLVKNKMQEFANAEFVITDRLHGMIFSAISGTPCIALDNNHHKVKGTYEWISNLPYIKYVDNIDKINLYLPELVKMQSCCYDNKAIIENFEPLIKEIGRYVN